MNHYRIRFLGALPPLATLSLASPSHAESGAVRVIFTKGGFIVGVGGGHGVLNFRGHNYPFTVSGISVGFTFGGSTTYLAGAHFTCIVQPIFREPMRIGAGGALAAAPAACSSKSRGVVLQLAGGKVGVELSAAVGGVTIALQ